MLIFIEIENRLIIILHSTSLKTLSNYRINGILGASVFLRLRGEGIVVLLSAAVNPWVEGDCAEVFWLLLRLRPAEEVTPFILPILSVTSGSEVGPLSNKYSWELSTFPAAVGAVFLTR